MEFLARGPYKVFADIREVPWRGASEIDFQCFRSLYLRNLLRKGLEVQEDKHALQLVAEQSCISASGTEKPANANLHMKNMALNLLHARWRKLRNLILQISRFNGRRFAVTQVAITVYR